MTQTTSGVYTAPQQRPMLRATLIFAGIAFGLALIADLERAYQVLGETEKAGEARARAEALPAKGAPFRDQLVSSIT